MQATRRRQGFTLIELLVTLALAAILASVAVPSYAGYIANQRAKAVGQELFVSLNYARGEAIKRNGSVRMRRSNDDWAKGWEVVADGQVLRLTGAGERGALAGMVIEASGAEVEFLRSGRVTAPVSFRICDSAGRATAREVSIEASGRPLITLGGACS